MIQTEKETFNFYRAELEKQRIYLSDSDFQYKIGKKSVDFWSKVLTPDQLKHVDTEGLTSKKRALFLKFPEKYIKRVSGIEKTLRTLRNCGLKIALSTQNEREMVDGILEWLNIGRFFSAVLTLQDITNKKPHPEIFLSSAAKLGVAPEECAVVEDSKDGILACKNAGMRCIGVIHEYTPKGHLENADLQISDISLLTPELIRNLK